MCKYIELFFENLIEKNIYVNNQDLHIWVHNTFHALEVINKRGKHTIFRSCLK